MVMHLLTAALLLAAPSQVLAKVAYKLHEQMALPQGWSVHSSADDETFRLSIALQHQNIDKLISKLYAVSTPGSSEYGKHWDLEQVNELIKPSTESHDAVTEWLRSENVPFHSDGFYIDTQMSVAKANELFAANYKYYQSAGVKKLRTTQYSVPQHLSQYIDLLEPSTYFGKLTPFLPQQPRDPGRDHKDATATEQLEERSADVTVRTSKAYFQQIVSRETILTNLNRFPRHVPHLYLQAAIKSCIIPKATYQMPVLVVLWALAAS